MATTNIEPLVYQLRYYSADNEKNIPSDPNKWVGLSNDLTKSQDLLTNYGAAIKLGIQTLPGVRFFISGNNFTDGIIIDHTGIYDLDLRNTNTAISNLYFDVASLARIDSVDNASIIIDLLCNPKDGTVNA